MFQLSWLVSRIKDLFEFFPDIHGYGWSSPWFPAATTPPEDRRELGCPNGKAHRGSRGGVVSGDGIGYKKPEKTRGFSPGLWPIWGIFMGSMWPYIAAPWIRHGWWQMMGQFFITLGVVFIPIHHGKRWEPWGRQLRSFSANDLRNCEVLGE
jgi:hypothetical protein